MVLIQAILVVLACLVIVKVCKRFVLSNKVLQPVEQEPEEEDFDPMDNEVLQRFDVVKQSTGCLFAKRSKIWSTPTWDPQLSVEENTKLYCIPVLAEFCNLIKHKRRIQKKDPKAAEDFVREQGLDGLIVECKGKQYGDSVDSVAKTFRKFCQTISDNDPYGSDFMQVSPLNFTSWNFLFDDEAFFITTFANCYPITHPRHSYGLEGLYIFLQPEESFTDHHIPLRGTPGSIRWKIRENFKRMGQAYEHNEPRHAPVAWWFVRPIEIGQAAIAERDRLGVELEENEFGEPYERGYDNVDWYSYVDDDVPNPSN